MEDLDSLIAAFAAGDANHLQLIQKLELHGGDRAVAFLARVAGDEDEDDFVRIEALKAIRVWEGASAEVRLEVGASLIQTLKGDDEDLVRGFAGMALSNFFEAHRAFDTLRAVVSDAQEDEDVRHNAFDALEDHLADERVQKLMTELAQLEGSIGAAAKRKMRKST